MRPQTFAVVLLALVSGLAAVWGVNSLRRKPPTAAVAEEKTAVAFALEDLPQDEPIDAEKIEIRQIPKSQAPEGALASAEDVEARIPAIATLKGEAVVEAKLLPRGEKPATFSVVFALKDLVAGMPIDPSWVEARDVPRSKAPEGFLVSAEDAASRAPAVAIPKDEPVVELKLLPRESRPNLALMVPPGMRAFTVQTPRFSPTLAGLIRRGNRVDVLLTTAPSDQASPAPTSPTAAPGPAKAEAATVTVIQNAEVLEFHETSNPRDELDGAAAVTLLVTPRQAAVLDLARNKGSLQLSLRNDDDAASVENATATLADLALEPDLEPTTLTIRTLRGATVGRDVIRVPRGRRAAPAPAVR